jgi:hypothetical protein
VNARRKQKAPERDLRFGAFGVLVQLLGGVMAAGGMSVRCAAGFAGASGPARGAARSAAARAAFAAGAGFRVGADELVEVAARTTGGLLLIDKGEAVLVEFGKELFPVDFFQGIVVAILRVAMLRLVSRFFAKWI